MKMPPAHRRWLTPRIQGAVRLRDSMTSTFRADVDGIYDAIHKASQAVPRYLFRAWSPEPGDNEKLNTMSEVTSHALLEGPKQVSDVPAKTLADSLVAHLSRALEPTANIPSWSASLPFVLGRALTLVQRTPATAHVAIVDTRKLAPNNHVC